MSRLRSVTVSVCVVAAVVTGLWFTQAAGPPDIARVRKQDKAPAVNKKEKRVRLSDTTVRNALKKTIDFGGVLDPKQNLEETLDLLERSHRISFEVNEKAFVHEGLEDVRKTEIANPNPVQGARATLEVVLRRILSRVPSKTPATFLIRKAHVEITTEAALRRELNLPAPKLDDKKAVWTLTPIVWEEFRNEPLEDALYTIAEAMDTTIVIDQRVREKAGTKIDATLRNVPLGTAVELLVEMAGLAVVKRANAFYVTTPENAERLNKAKAK